MYTNENLFVYNKIKKTTIQLVAIRFELSELNKIKNGYFASGDCTISRRNRTPFFDRYDNQKYISKPLLNLVTTIQTIKDTADYKIRMM
jgi:hypothetical protein